MTGQIRTALDADGVLVATIDMPDRTMNVFSVELMDALDALMDRVDGDDAVRSCVVTSGKPTFLAGADLQMVRGYCDAGRTDTPAQLALRCGRLGRQFVRLEASAKPWVAAVNGLALGGGLELALACRERHVADDPRLQVGVPEVRWGLLPGAGGTQRLPRLAPFDAAMRMLLTGRSIDPAAALELGVATSLVPKDRLLDAAKAAARRLHDTAYDPAVKFGRLAQADVPADDPAAARAIASGHGVDADDFAQYPAYGAIVDSVLKGRGLPLAEATTVEMDQFVRLMIDPTAGRMVGTLFLERLRAERESAPPKGVGIERLRVGPLGAAKAAWREAFSKARLAMADEPALPPDTIEVVDLAGAVHRAELRVLGDAAAHASGPTLVLAPAGPYGRVVEIVGADDADGAVLAALAVRLAALPWRSPGPQSRLAVLAGQSLAEQAATASGWTDRACFGDPAFVDVAACLAGIAPAWSGGPLRWQAERPAAAHRVTSDRVTE